MMLYYYKYKVNKHIIFFESFKGKSYSDSPKAIYETLLNTKNSYKFVWAFNSGGLHKLLPDQKRTTCVYYNSREYYRYFSKAQYIVTNSTLLEHIKKKNNQILIQTWHGTPLKRLGCDINVNQENSFYSLREIYKLYESNGTKMDYLVSPSAYATEKLTSTFNLKKLKKEHIVLEAGYPRNDFLINHKKDEVERIKQKLDLPTNKRVILYAPTYRDNSHEVNSGYIFTPNIDFDLLEKNLCADYIILFRAHYLVGKSFNFEKHKGFIYDVSHTDDVNYLYIISDLLITDYSSVFFDYANLKRPIIYFMYDLESYQNKLRGFYLDLDELPGPIVKDEIQLIETIKQIWSDSNNTIERIAKFSAQYNYLDDGNASDRVLKMSGIL